MRSIPRAALMRLKRTEGPLARAGLLRLQGLLHAAAYGHLVRRGRVRSYLRQHGEEPRLHVGAGPHRLPGWLDTDLVSGEVHLDLSRRLPLRSGSFAYAFAEHLIEHLSEPAGTSLLAELHRVLRPGGVLRLTTPDLRKVIALYEDRNPVIGREAYYEYLSSQTGKHYAQPCRMLNDLVRLWGHRYLYDEEDLAAKCLSAGFVAVTRHEPGESEHPALRGIERHGSAPWVNDAEAMCLEARKAAEPTT